MSILKYNISESSSSNARTNVSEVQWLCSHIKVSFSVPCYRERSAALMSRDTKRVLKHLVDPQHFNPRTVHRLRWNTAPLRIRTRLKSCSILCHFDDNWQSYVSHQHQPRDWSFTAMLLVPLDGDCLLLLPTCTERGTSIGNNWLR